jgi:hypothetical protein
MDARNWNRHLVEKEVGCSIDGANTLIFLYDLCCGGCMIELADASEALGKVAVVDLYEREQARGEIVWQSGRCAGVRFDEPIHDAVVRHVGFNPPAAPFEQQAPRDRFGRVLPPIDAGERRSKRAY